MPSLSQLEYILAVAKHKHFGRAAKSCFVSQPSLSAQVQKAEDELDIVIFDRSKSPIKITQLGQEVIDQAKKIISEHKKLLDIHAQSTELSGSFHLGVIPTLSPYILPLFIKSFSDNYPKVELTISEHKTQDIIEKLYDDQIDGGLLVTPLYDDKIIERSLFYEPFYAFMSNKHPLIKKKTVSETQLQDYPIWLLDEGHCFREQVIKVCAFKNKPEVLNNVHFDSGNLETLKNLIRRGDGYTLIPHLSTLDLSEQEKKHQLKKFKTPVPTREVSLVHSRTFLKEHIINAIIDCIIDNVPNELSSLKKRNIERIEI
ncbi:LysR substrate-binding domain-containing protein [bacterium]|nr:LysR substrate-binding domain-containing protein [bacterium]